MSYSEAGPTPGAAISAKTAICPLAAMIAITARAPRRRIVAPSPISQRPHRSGDRFPLNLRRAGRAAVDLGTVPPAQRRLGCRELHHRPPRPPCSAGSRPGIGEQTVLASDEGENCVATCPADL